MLDRILLNPDNRLLGSATGDLGLYGGSVDPAIEIRQAPDGEPVAPRPESEDGNDIDTPAAVSPAHSILAPGVTALESGAPVTAASVLSAPVLQAPAAAPVEGLAITTLAPAAPTGFAPGVNAPDTGSASSAVPQEADTAPAPVADSLSLDAVQPLVDSGVLGATLDSLAGDVGALAGVASPLVEGLGGTVSQTVGGVGDTLDTVVGAATDTLAGLAGADPAGGVATLVSLVSVTDMFDLHPVDAPVLADASGDPGLAILDTLAADVADPLLGVAHDADGAVDHVLDHALGL